MALTPSPGDLLQVLQLGVGAYKALDEKTGSTDEYRKLKNELRDLNNLFEIFRKEELRFIPEAYRIIVVQRMSESTATAEDIERFLKGYSSLDLGVRSSGWKKKFIKTYEKLRWKIFKSKDVPKLESKLSQYRSSLICFMQIANSAKFNSLLRNPSFDSSNGVTIVDLLGKSLVLPLLFCESWDVLQEHLIIYYKYHAQAGSDYVKRGDYGFLITNNGECVTNPAVWGTIVKAGMEFQMAALLQMLGTSETLRCANRTCPRCRKLCSGITPGEKKHMTCKNCAMCFEVIDRMPESASRAVRLPFWSYNEGQLWFKAYLLVLLEITPKVHKKKGWFRWAIEKVKAKATM